jgi:deoxyguanosine kinase
MPHHPFIAVEGVIGVGKTTLARLLQPNLGGELLLEVFEENPFLEDFYADRERYAFQTQIFFLLSRYRQQQLNVPDGLTRGPVVSDYTFAKDRLFANLNLDGDELTVYNRLHDALAEKIVPPDLLIYLRADLDVLLARISARDRSYERDIDPLYIEEVRQAYEHFIQTYDQAPVLVIDTNHLNIVQEPDDLALVVERVRSALGRGTHQPALPGVEMGPSSYRPARPAPSRRLTDLQSQHFDRPPLGDWVYDFACLSQQIGRLAGEIGTLRLSGELPPEGRARLHEELAACLSFLLRLSNDLEVDLEEAYLERLARSSDPTLGEEDL